MKRFLIKVLIFSSIVMAIVAGANYFVDQANIFHYGIVDDMVEKLTAGNIIDSPGNLDEGLYVEGMLSSLDYSPSTVIIGSSHIMYEDWEFENYFNAGLSGAYLGDYYAVVGILEAKSVLPERIVIGVDPWSFMRDCESGRHTSIRDYAQYTKALIEGNDEAVPPLSKKVTLKKVQELFSFSYFQTSMRSLRANGIGTYLNRSEAKAVISPDSKIGEKQKILPNGRRIFARDNFMSRKDNADSAEAAIAARSIYQMGAGFSDIQYDNLEEFERLLQYLQSKDIEVVFYLHSCYPMIYDFLKKDSDYQGVIKLEQYIREMAADYDIVVHGSYDPEAVNFMEDDFADWNHLKPDKMMQCYYYVRK